MHSENEVVYLYLDDIIPNRFQPRELFDERALKELAVSIKEHGVIQPIIVRKNGEKYEIIAGERRYKASALAGLTKIPAIIRDLDDKESSKVALLENLQRKNLNAIEEAKTYQKILEIDQMTQEELAKTMGKSQSAVANKLRLLSLSEGVQNALLNAKISERHARTLLSINDKEEQERLVKQVIQNKITVRELERLIKQDKEMTEDIDEERSRPISKPTEDEEIFREPEFDMSDENKHKPQPPIPDTLIDFEDVTRELERKENKYEEGSQRDGEVFSPNLGDSLQSVRTAPDSSFEETEEPRFINYGEIDPDDNNDDDEDDSPEKLFNFTSTPDLEDDNIISSNDRYNQSRSNVSSLDSLLNINKPKLTEKHDARRSSTSSKIVDSFENSDEFSDDEDGTYENEDFVFEESSDVRKDDDDFVSFDESLFKTPTIEEFGAKNKVSSIKTSSLKPSSYRGALKRDAYPNESPIEENDHSKRTMNYDIQYGINSIRDTIRQLEKENLQIDTDEMNFENSYQIVIKIQKSNSDDK